MKRWQLLISLGLLAALCLPVSVVLASDISTADYIGTVRVHNENVRCANG